MGIKSRADTGSDADCSQTGCLVAGGDRQAENDGSRGVIEQWDKRRVKGKARKHGHVERRDERVGWFSSWHR